MCRIRGETRYCCDEINQWQLSARTWLTFQVLVVVLSVVCFDVFDIQYKVISWFRYLNLYWASKYDLLRVNESFQFLDVGREGL